MLMNASTQNYNDDVYYNPIWAEHNPLDVGGGRNANVGNYLCLSGHESKAVCGNRVASAHGEKLCTPGCTYGLVGTRKAGRRDPCIPGDSGGPMFRREAHTDVAGIIIGFKDYGQKCVGERTSSIENHLSVTVARTP